MLNKNTIQLRVWTLALEPYAKHYEATLEHHMILNRGVSAENEPHPAGMYTEVKSSGHIVLKSDSDKNTGKIVIDHDCDQAHCSWEEHSFEMTRIKFIYWQSISLNKEFDYSCQQLCVPTCSAKRCRQTNRHSAVV